MDMFYLIPVNWNWSISSSYSHKTTHSVTIHSIQHPYPIPFQKIKLHTQNLIKEKSLKLINNFLTGKRYTRNEKWKHLIERYCRSLAHWLNDPNYANKLFLIQKRTDYCRGLIFSHLLDFFFFLYAASLIMSNIVEQKEEQLRLIECFFLLFFCFCALRTFCRKFLENYQLSSDIACISSSISIELKNFNEKMKKISSCDSKMWEQNRKFIS